MNNVLSIYEAKTNFSKLVKRAAAGETIYVGAYGKPEVIVTVAPQKKKIQFGVLKHEAIKDAYKYEDLVDPDPEMIAWAEKDDPLLK